MAAQKHIIGRHLLLLKLPHTYNNKAALSIAEDMEKETVLPILGSVFDGMGQNRVRIEKLQVKIVCNQADFENGAWKEMLRKNITEAIKKNTENYPERGKNDTLSTEEEAFVFYLINGCLPWWFDKEIVSNIGFRQWVREVWKQWVQNVPNFKQPSFVWTNQAIQRLGNYIDAADVKFWIVNWYQQGTAKEIRLILEILGDSQASKSGKAQKSFQAVKLKLITNIIRFYDNQEGFVSFLREMVKQSLKKDYPIVKAPTQVAKHEELLEEKNKQLFPSEKIVNNLQDNDLFIPNAGMVLLANYLPRLFENLKISNDKLMLEKDKALLLLQYLCWENDNNDEQDWPLFKILCGLPIDAALNAGAKITSLEKQEADKMLAAAIAYWKALKNTTPNGLRATFLQREGRLRVDESSSRVTLLIQNETVDVLLDSLPWSFGYIRLPWMKQLLQTNWIN